MFSLSKGEIIERDGAVSVTLGLFNHSSKRSYRIMLGFAREASSEDEPFDRESFRRNISSIRTSLGGSA
ncbi:hypothetical protein J2J97_28190 (plasmid) [Rhizobium bangladeshense]|jgi:hypothetical protein|uniref:hypothetical protein n=1 Tax=Rhizobium bangladeshense TaxID=1138189 RepID=UPI000DDA6003|nr:hypothetical protein [Rhizobium bangladeshense]QSY97990.1 hypothetical protein J2J97_28190 [Rhizobium bangladeshense]